MFNEDEDWNDEQDDQVLSKAVPKNPQKASSSPNVKKPKVVGKKSLLRTLQRLGKVQELEWKNESQKQDSDSETEKVPVTSQEEEVKEKKKRIYRRKRGKKAETTEEQQDDGDKDQPDKDQPDKDQPVKDQPDKDQTVKDQTVKDQTVKDQTVKEDEPVTKKRKKDKKNGESKENTTSVVETEQKETIQPAKVDVNTPENTDGLNRKQWRNKMKNKKKCKNKYSEKKPEEEVNKADKIKTDSHSNGNNNNQDKNSLHTPPPAQKKRKELKPQKRKKTKEDTDVTTETPTLTGEKEKKKTKTVTESPAPEPVVEMVTDVQTPAKKLKPELSKEQIMKREKLRKMLRSPETQTNLEQCPVEQTDKMAASEGGEEGTLDRSASLRSRMQQRLESARFRYINELLYSTSSGEAKRMFSQDPEAFGIYHRGYTAQVHKWPANPVDAIIADIQKKPPSLVVADFGCGDCKIARSVKNKVHSFDLASICELVTVCDMANVPLKDGSVDIAVFCLSLMGTNLADFLAEANRVLKMGGVLKIAEVASRFENVRSFITGLANLGFKMESKGTENTHFHSFECVKTEEAPENVKKYGLELRPCVYKKR